MRDTVDDTVWAAIPPGTGRLARRTRRRLIGLAVTLTLLLLTVMVLERTGPLGSQIALVSGWDGDFVAADGRTLPAVRGNRPTAVVRSTFFVQNTGWTDLRLRDLTVAGPGIDLLGAQIGDQGVIHEGSYRLAAEENARLTVELRITDCRAAASPGVTVTVEAWYGTRTLTLPTPRLRHHNGGWQVTTVDDPAGVDAVRYLADKVCEAGR